LNEPTGKIPSVDWWITSKCNLACDFCYGPKPVGDPVGLQEKIVEALASSSARVVTFCGGEPLLVPKISEYAARLNRSGKSAVLNTNGQLLTSRIDNTRPGWKFQLADFAMVGLSMDGSTQEVHRAMRGEGADLDEVRKAAELVSAQSGVKLKIATVVSSVNREDLPKLAKAVRVLAPDIWRLYQYSSRGAEETGGINRGQKRHPLSDDEFRQLAEEAEVLADPVPTAPYSEAETEGCLIVDPAGNVLQPTRVAYNRHGNCLKESLDDIWAEIKPSAQFTIIENKHWLSVLD
jgi:MoaA/NifB/PqqE/SkfB family radical SAM enzyme